MSARTNTQRQGQREEELPIDINSEKLVEWLVARNKVAAEWSRPAAALRERVDRAKGELPLDIKTTLEGAPTHYWACRRVLDELERREREDPAAGKLKNIFGRYNSETLHEWDGIVRAYQKGNLHLADAGRLLSQDVVYEVPLMKRTLQQNEKQVTDLRRRVADSERGAADNRRSFAEQCEKMGVAGRDVRREIRQSVRHLAPLLHEVEQLATGEDVVEAVAYYRAFARFCLAAVHGQEKADAASEALLGTFDLIRAAAEGRRERGEVLQVAAAEEEADAEAEDAAAVEIDWGISLEDAGAGAADGAAGSDDDGFVQIDWNLALEGSGEDAAGAGGADAAAAGEDGDGVAEINWDITIEAGGEEGDAAAAGEEEEEAAGTAAADSSLDDDTTRQAFLTDLLELEAFLDQRLRETRESSSDGMYHAKFRAAPQEVQRQSEADLERRLGAVQGLLGALKSPRLQQLLLIRASDRYVERLASSLTQKVESAERLEQAARTLEARRADLEANTGRTARRLRATIAGVKELQKHVEQAMSEMLDGRRVNLFGDINTL